MLKKILDYTGKYTYSAAVFIIVEYIKGMEVVKVFNRDSTMPDLTGHVIQKNFSKCLTKEVIIKMLYNTPRSEMEAFILS